MLYINKKKTPKDILTNVQDVKKTPGLNFRELTLPNDVEKLRQCFDMLAKKPIKTSLLQEQHGLCAYCMKKIVVDTSSDDAMHIEHYIPLSVNKDTALDYQNFLGVCDGGSKHDAETMPVVECCDISRKNVGLTINPLDERQMRAIKYYNNGLLYVAHDAGLTEIVVQSMQHDIDYVLQLNGKLDANGKWLHDTYTKLVFQRKSIIDSINHKFAKLAEKGNLDVEHVEDYLRKQEELYRKNELPFAGVWFYFCQRKLAKLRKYNL